MAIQHSASTQIHKGRYIQSADPGAVGAGIEWLDTTTSPYIHKKRNTGNTDWDTVLNPTVLLATTNMVGYAGLR